MWFWLIQMETPFVLFNCRLRVSYYTEHLAYLEGLRA